MDSEDQNVQSPRNNKLSFSCTRLLDNHYDPKIHEKPWKSPGHLRDYKYEYCESGLGYIIPKQHKMRNFKDKQEQMKEVEDLQKNSNGFRKFREYENLSNNEVLITIEYCTNCKQHQGSTRHDEEKYAYFANNLKKQIMVQYPVVKVVLKPLMFTEEESAEQIFLRSRIGAFEVQLVSKNNKGEMRQKYIFSKLKTGNWPYISKVVESISNYLPTCDFFVQVIDPNHHPEEEAKNNNHDQNNQAQENKIKGLNVILRPLRKNNNTNTNTKTSPSKNELQSSSKFLGESARSGMASARSRSGVFRPDSAYSSISGKSTTNLRKNSPKGNEGSGTTQGAKEYVEQTDDYGVVMFKQVPHNIYEIEIIENHNYLPEKRVSSLYYVLA